MMKTLLQITMDEDGTLSLLSDSTEPLSETLKLEIYHLLRQVDPLLRRRSAPYDGPNPELAQKLIDWRREESRAQGVSAYIVLSQKVLYAIADAAPQTMGELLNIPGFGPVSFDKYGMDILKMTTGLCPSNEL